jgi:tripartite-type tricarboxylate transporter receptor subunit TctC
MKKLSSVTLACFLATAVGALAETYPSKPITFIVPYAAGGQLDMITRTLLERMREPLGQTLIVDNVTGAGGSLGTGRAARAAPDGYTVAMGNWNTHVANGAIYSLQYDVLRDFEPVALLPYEPVVVFAKNMMAARNLSEFIAWLRANGDAASMGTSGVGAVGHVAGILFQRQTSTRFQFVPYRGAGPAIQDLIAGQIDFVITGPSIALEQMRAGAIKAYAVAAKTRSAAAPDIPTTDEAGLPGFYIGVWQGAWFPKGTPKDIIAKLNAAVRHAMADPTVRERFDSLGLEIPPAGQQTPEALAAFHKAEIEKWWPIIKEAKIKAQ